MRELGGVPGGLPQDGSVERRQLRNERQRRLDLFDLAGRLAVLLDDPLHTGAVANSGNLERLAVCVVDVHRKIFDEDRVAVRDRIEIGAGERRVIVEFRLVTPGDQPSTIGRQLGGGVSETVEGGLFGLQSLDHGPVGRRPVELPHIYALPKHPGDLRMHVRFDEARNDHRILKSPVDLHLLVGDPTADFVQRADAKDLAVHHRHRFGGGRAGIESHDRLRRVDGDFSPRRLGGRRCGTGRNERIDAARLAGKLVMGDRQCRRRQESRGKEDSIHRPHVTAPSSTAMSLMHPKGADVGPLPTASQEAVRTSVLQMPPRANLSCAASCDGPPPVFSESQMVGAAGIEPATPPV